MKQYVLVLLFGCGGSSEVTADAPPSTIVFGGQAAEVTTGGLAPLGFLRVEAFDRDDEVTPIAMTDTDMLGNFQITLSAPFDGYLRARHTGYVDTYLYAPGPLAASYEGAPLRLAKAETLALLDSICGGGQQTAKGRIAAIATDPARAPVAGVAFASTPAASKYCYTGSDGYPSTAQLTTSSDGVGYLFNVIGPVTLTASKNAATSPPRLVTARADVVTMVLVSLQP